MTVEGNVVNTKVDEIIKQIPAWKDMENLRVEPLAGLNNTNYLVRVNGDRFVLRVSGQNTVPLGINREYEFEVLTAVSEAGIGAHVEYSLLPEGHLVTGFINRHHLTLEEYLTRENVQRIVKTLKRLHNLPFISATFSPFRSVERYAQQAQSMRVPFPDGFDKLFEKMGRIEQEQAGDKSPWHGFCHNDLFCVNVLDDGKI
jgi:thiamine kinase-like enzyme